MYTYHMQFKRDIASVCFNYWKTDCKELGIHSVEDYLKDMEITYIAHNDIKWYGSVSIDKIDLITHQHLTPWLTSLYVNPEHRGKGIASMLLYSVLKDYTKLYLWCTKNMSSFYRKFGFHCIETVGDRAIMLKHP